MTSKKKQITTRETKNTEKKNTKKEKSHQSTKQQTEGNVNEYRNLISIKRFMCV